MNKKTDCIHYKKNVKETCSLLNEMICKWKECPFYCDQKQKELNESLYGKHEEDTALYKNPYFVAMRTKEKRMGFQSKVEACPICNKIPDIVKVKNNVVRIKCEMEDECHYHCTHICHDTTNLQRGLLEWNMHCKWMRKYCKDTIEKERKSV